MPAVHDTAAAMSAADIQAEMRMPDMDCPGSKTVTDSLGNSAGAGNSRRCGC